MDGRRVTRIELGKQEEGGGAKYGHFVITRFRNNSMFPELSTSFYVITAILHKWYMK